MSKLLKATVPATNNGQQFVSALSEGLGINFCKNMLLIFQVPKMSKRKKKEKIARKI